MKSAKEDSGMRHMRGPSCTPFNSFADSQRVTVFVETCKRSATSEGVNSFSSDIKSPFHNLCVHYILLVQRCVFLSYISFGVFYFLTTGKYILYDEPKEIDSDNISISEPKGAQSMEMGLTVRRKLATDLVTDFVEYSSEREKELIQKSKAKNTRRGYLSDWRHFTAYCETFGYQYLPASPETITRYLMALSDQGYKISTIQRRISSVSQAHQAAGFDPISMRTKRLKDVWQGIKNEKGTAQKGKAAILLDELRMLVDTLPDNLLGARDRALILIGFAGAFRRSELVNINIEHLEFKRDGLTIYLPKSKTDQEGEGRHIGIPYGEFLETCPIRSLQLWLEHSAITSGPVFRPVAKGGKLQDSRLSDKAVALVVKRCATAAGLDASKYAGHSLRAGLVTSAAIGGAPEERIMAQTGHKSVNMVRRYTRIANLFKNNAASYVGL